MTTKKISGEALFRLTSLNASERVNKVINFTGLEAATNLQELSVFAPNKRILMNNWSQLR